MPLHPLLARQIRRSGVATAMPEAGAPGTGAPETEAFVALIDAAYRQFDADRALLERSLDLTSAELRDQNARLRAELAERESSQGRLEREVARHRQTTSARVVAETARDEAEQMLRLKSSFLANMSHELRTPLTGILGYADLLTDEVTGEAAEMVSVIARSATRLCETVNSVLDLAQLESGGVRLRLESVDLVSEADEALRLLQPLAAARSLALRLGTPDATVCAYADRAAVHRVLNNLVGNALKFTQCGSITVSVGTCCGLAEIRVADTGPGIDPDFLPHLYDAFRQESDGHARTHEGNGLGLAITAGLVDLMDGHITVESERGTGTTFTVRLPLAVAPTEADGSVRSVPVRAV